MDGSTNAPTRAVAFSRAQALEWTGLKAETLRYWKGALTPIAGRDTRSSGYSLEEIVALAVIARATGRLKVPVQLFADHADAVFAAAASLVANATTESLLVIAGEDIRFARPDDLPDDEVLVIVRMDMVLRDVKARMTNPSTPSMQPDLFDRVA